MEYIIIGVIAVLFAGYLIYKNNKKDEEPEPPAPPPAPPEPEKPKGIWKEIIGGQLHKVRESLFNMKEFSRNDKLYGATESTGKTVIFNGINWDIDFDTDRLGHGAWNNSYHLGECGNFLYTGFHDFGRKTSIKIFRTNGTKWGYVHEEKGAKQVRFVEDFYGWFLTIFSDYATNRSWIYKKKKGSNTKDIGVFVKSFPHWFYGDPLVHDGILYIGGDGIYAIDRGFNATREYNAGDKVITSIGMFNDTPHATMMQPWRSKTGNGWLLKRGNGRWSLKVKFSEPEAWCQAVMWDNLYIGTRRDGGGGKVYELDKNYKDRVVGTTPADGFFSLCPYQGKLFAGTYSMSQVRSYMYY